jgi:predicted membrane protein
MPIFGKLGAKDIALTACFAALYVVLSFLPSFPLVGSSGSITVATIIAPIIGILLGAYLGTVSTLLGGIVSLFFRSFTPFSLAGGVVGALFGALLYQGKRTLCILFYLALLLVFGFYPSVGPAWVFLPYMWFQAIGFLILISPLQSAASKSFKSDKNTRLLFAFFITSLTSTMAAQIAGTLVFEAITDPRGYWIILAAVYPVERITIAIIATLIGAPLLKVMKSANLVYTANRPKSESAHITCLRAVPNMSVLFNRNL